MKTRKIVILFLVCILCATLLGSCSKVKNSQHDLAAKENEMIINDSFDEEHEIADPYSNEETEDDHNYEKAKKSLPKDTKISSLKVEESAVVSTEDAKRMLAIFKKAYEWNIISGFKWYFMRANSIDPQEVPPKIKTFIPTDENELELLAFAQQLKKKTNTTKVKLDKAYKNVKGKKVTGLAHAVKTSAIDKFTLKYFNYKMDYSKNEGYFPELKAIGYGGLGGTCCEHTVQLAKKAKIDFDGEYYLFSVDYAINRIDQYYFSDNSDYEYRVFTMKGTLVFYFSRVETEESVNFYINKVIDKER